METTQEPQSGRELAPGRLALVQELINSCDLEAGTDELTDPEALGRWLHARGLLSGAGGLGQADLERAQALREALRTLLLERGRGAVGAASLGELETLARPAALRVGFDASGAPVLAAAAGGLDGAFAELLSAIAAAELEGTWARLKVCADEECRWAFYDRSKNRSGSWCSMAVCGNRNKARTFRERRRGVGTGD